MHVWQSKLVSLYMYKSLKNSMHYFSGSALCPIWKRHFQLWILCPQQPNLWYILGLWYLYDLWCTYIAQYILDLEEILIQNNTNLQLFLYQFLTGWGKESLQDRSKTENRRNESKTDGRLDTARNRQQDRNVNRTNIRDKYRKKVKMEANLGLCAWRRLCRPRRMPLHSGTLTQCPRKPDTASWALNSTCTRT